MDGFRKFFKEDKCTRCGECFVRCRYLRLSRKDAIREIEELINGGPARKVMAGCASCYACNVFCPEEADPYFLILDRWDRRYRERGLPVRASYLLPYHDPNYRTDMEAEMTERERQLLSQWRQNPEQGEFLYPGCNLLTLPLLYDLPLFESLPASGDWSLCCGEPFFRLGLFEVMEEIAERLTRHYAGKPITRMVFVCPACYNMFKNVLPRMFGARFDFECEYLGSRLLRGLEGGEWEPSRELSGKVAVHDSCHGRILGAEVMEGARDLLSGLGLSVVNLRLHHEEGLCCGIGAGCNRQMPQDIMRAGLRELREGTGAGAEEMAIYCTGCYLVLNMLNHFRHPRQKLVHLLEYVGRALGREPERVVERRTRKILTNITKKALPLLLSPRGYKVQLPPLNEP